MSNVSEFSSVLSSDATTGFVDCSVSASYIPSTSNRSENPAVSTLFFSARSNVFEEPREPNTEAEVNLSPNELIIGIAKLNSKLIAFRRPVDSIVNKGKRSIWDAKRDLRLLKSSTQRLAELFEEFGQLEQLSRKGNVSREMRKVASLGEEMDEIDQIIGETVTKLEEEMAEVMEISSMTSAVQKQIEKGNHIQKRQIQPKLQEKINHLENEATKSDENRICLVSYSAELSSRIWNSSQLEDNMKHLKSLKSLKWKRFTIEASEKIRRVRLINSHEECNRRQYKCAKRRNNCLLRRTICTRKEELLYLKIDGGDISNSKLDMGAIFRLSEAMDENIQNKLFLIENPTPQDFYILENLLRERENELIKLECELTRIEKELSERELKLEAEENSPTVTEIFFQSSFLAA